MFECEACPFDTNNVDQIEFHETENEGHRMFPMSLREIARPEGEK